MNVIGLGGSVHDFSAALCRDGEIVVAIEAERLTRQKHGVDRAELARAIEARRLWSLRTADHGSMLEVCVKYCLEAAGLGLADIDAVGATDTLGRPLALSGTHRLYNHHLAHAASTYFPSNFDSAAILVVDGNGSFVQWQGAHGYEAATITHGREGSIELLDKTLTHSIGHFYEAVTMGLAFGPLEEGKTMGLASFGRPGAYLGFGAGGSEPEGWRASIAAPPNEVRLRVSADVAEVADRDRFQRRADIAWAAQQIVETGMLWFARRALELTGATRLCLAGGVALNSVANGRIAAELPIEDLFVQPAAGDNGLAIGAALLAERDATPRRRGGWRQVSGALGRTYSSEAVRHAVEQTRWAYRVEGGVARRAAELLASGCIGGWFTGGSEFGPRALGFRSILADPRRPDMKDTLNARVKHREWFRPFAPAVLEEYVHEYFDCRFPSPFMLIVAPVRPEMASIIPAVVHVDGSARLQTVSEENNPYLYELLHEFHRLTSVPVLLNTSFNDRDQPIIETPEDALRCFKEMDLDFLVLENYLLQKPDLAEGGHHARAAEGPAHLLQI